MKKLSLSRETLATLTDTSLALVHGGVLLPKPTRGPIRTTTDTGRGVSVARCKTVIDHLTDKLGRGKQNR